MARKVEECTMVTIEFSVRTATRDGQTAELPPRTCRFVYGIDAQYPSVDKVLAGHEVGDRLTVSVPPEELYGTYDESLVREIPREDCKEERLKAGKMYREMRRKCLVEFMVREIRENTVLVDFNDPMAGCTAEIDILIVDVREASKSELRPSCARGPEIMSDVPPEPSA